MTNSTVMVKEIFTSVQGEGSYVGYKQLFIRFCECNLDCKYCDTDSTSVDATSYTVEELVDICNKNKDCHSVALTGGEPLLQVEFLKEFLPKCPLPVYLETNGTLYENLAKVIDDVDYIAMDVKLPSATGGDPLWKTHDKFLEIAKQKNVFIKAVFTSKITDAEMALLCVYAEKYDVDLVLQPAMKVKKGKPEFVCSSKTIMKVFGLCAENYAKTRLIPQVHKYLDIQ